MAGGPGLGGKVVKGKMGFQPKSKVVAQFVDAIPDLPPAYGGKEHRAPPFQKQEGVVEALTLAMQNKGRAMLLVEYDSPDMSPSRRRQAAKMRARGLSEGQGYNENNGWIVRAVDNKVYVLYQGAR